MKRREFITLVGGAAVGWPLAAGAQQPAMPVIGVLSSASPDLVPDRLRAFRQGLGEIGYIEGRNVALEMRWADRYDQLPGLAAELVRRKVSLIAALGNQPLALAAKGATSTIPIVFSMGADPLQGGLVASFSRPGGNITGITQLAGELISKRMQLLHELVPDARVIGALANPDNLNEATITSEQEAAGSLGMSIEIVKARAEADFDAAFESLGQLRVAALDVLPDTLFSSRPAPLAALAARHALPAVFYAKEFAKAGGLMSYGSDIPDSYRQVGVYAGRILKGEKPADLPVIQASKFELVLNLKTAKALGLRFPANLLAIADEVIE
jgi:putative tryptophan/tyrosine transport system substrate-binding protein